MQNNGPPHTVAVVQPLACCLRELVACLHELGGYNVVCSVPDANGYINAFKHLPPPMLALVELHMEDMNGVVLLQWIRQHQPGTRCVAFAVAPRPHERQRARQAGARAVLDLQFTLEALHNTLQDALLPSATLEVVHKVLAY